MHTAREIFAAGRRALRRRGLATTGAWPPPLAAARRAVVAERATPGRALLGIAVLMALLTVLGVGLRPRGPGAIAEPAAMAAVALLIVLSGLLYLAAVAVVRRAALPPGALWGILAFAVLMRGLLLATPPFLSTDVYRYVWDGRVQQAGINPYRYLPADPQLAPLRDAAIYPNINRADTATTPYPPVSEMIFRLAVRLAGPTVLGVKATLLVLEAVGVVALLLLLPRLGRRREEVLVYAWHPMVIWEFAGNGHVDAATIAFVGLALLALAHRRPGLVGLALGGAGLVKLLPFALAPTLWRRPDWRMPAALLATVALAYLPYLGVGAGVLGSLGGHVDEEGLSGGEGYLPLYLLQRLGVALPPRAGLIYAAAGLAVLAVLAWRMSLGGDRDGEKPLREVVRDCLVLGTGVILLVTPPYPWYFAWLVFLACLAPSTAVLALTVLSPLVYLEYFDPNHLGQVVMYGSFGVLLARGLRRRQRRPSPRPAPEPPVAAAGGVPSSART